jgi:hypothetical protein
MTTSALIIVAIPIGIISAVLFLAGKLIQRRMHTPDAPPNRLIDDLRGLEDALVDFFASSKVSAGILTVLAAHRKPIGFKALTEEVRASDSLRNHGEMPLTAIRSVLSILQFARLVRMRASGFSITELGREVHGRMGPESLPSLAPSVHNSAPRANGTSSRCRMLPVLSSHSRRVLSELRDRARTLVHHDLT